MAGLDPWQFTIRELAYASEQKQQAQWDHTAGASNAERAQTPGLHVGGHYGHGLDGSPSLPRGMIPVPSRVASRDHSAKVHR